MVVIKVRRRCVAGCLLAVLAPVVAAQDLPSGLLACRTEPDDSKRLACYDQQLDAGARSSPEPTGSDAESPAVAVVAAERFGLEGTLAQNERKQARAEGRELLELNSTVAQLANRPDGTVIITLENGQVWASKEGDPNLTLRVGDPVRIRRGAMGSYILNGRSSWTARVKRLQ